MSINDNPLKLKLFVQGESVPDFAGAACAREGLDPETWFLDDAETAKVAKGYCVLCPYGPGKAGDDSCYEYFIDVEEETGYFAFGIFGGRDAAYRQRILDRRKIAKGLDVEPPDEHFTG